MASMKGLIFFCVSLPCVLGIFDGRPGVTLPVNPTDVRSDLFPVTGNLLNCAADENGFLEVELNVTTPGEVFLPRTSGRSFPSLLNLVPSEMIFNVYSTQLNISSQLQTPTQPDFNDTLSFPFRYELDRFPDYGQLQEICGEDVLANFTEVNGSRRNEDQGTFWDISDTLENDWLEIWNRTDQTQYPGRSAISWRGDIILLFRDMMEVLSCRVAFRWADAGPTYVPRYFRGGFCLNRKCSLPDRDEFRCHADLSFSESRFLEAARWDCCWIFDASEGYKYQCGFRKVRFPIVCDCDCRCPDKAGI